MEWGINAGLPQHCEIWKLSNALAIEVLFIKYFCNKIKDWSPYFEFCSILFKACFKITGAGMHRHAPIIGPLRLLDKQTKTIIKLKFENSRIQSCKTQDRKDLGLENRLVFRDPH